VRKRQWWNHRLIRNVSEPNWEAASKLGVHDRMLIRAGSRMLLQGNEDELVNMSSYSYLGLDEDARILSGAIAGLQSARVLNSSLSRIRMRLQLLDEAEGLLSDLFGADTGTVASCSAAAWSLLPLMASGLITGGEPPVMVFDAHAHFCLQSLKAACADETEVVTIRHNDVERLEALCRKGGDVVYVADSVYSTGGSVAPMEDLIRLQAEYGLFVVFDEAHGTSVAGGNGEGFALSALGGINERTFVVTSLNKGFGASGGAILFGPRGDGRVRNIVARHGGPFLWSQRVNTAGLGAIKASVAIHAGSELAKLQSRLRSNIQLFDTLVPNTGGANSELPVRTLRIGAEDLAVKVAARFQSVGFYVEPDFFPVVPRAEAGLRIRVRANMSREDIASFSAVLPEVLSGVPTL